jgi:CRISPR-associated protein Cmr1
MVWKNSSNAVERSVIMRNQRKQPPVSPPDVTPVQKENVITQVREYQLITPLFGGGVTPGECDPVTVIRGTEIRGQLRFWWRATRGGRFADIKALKEEEDKIWGAPYKKGEEGVPHEETVQITVEVSAQGKGNPLYPFTQDNNGRTKFHNDKAPTYAAFPLQTSFGSVQANVSFTLSISFPETKRPDIEAALWAWETFGGVGARTRRGFGALRCKTIKENGKSVPVDLPSATQENVSNWIRRKLELYVAPGSWPAHVPHLRRQPVENRHFKLVVRNNNSNVMDTWRYLIESLKDFRQMRRQSTTQGANYPGRSMWPEPSAIRQITGQSHPRHRNPIPNPAVNKFPRAAFGLPIIFQFKDSNKYNSNDPQNDPRKTALELENYDRLASPLILKPLACQNGNFIGLAFVLTGNDFEGEKSVLKAQERPSESWPVEISLKPGEAFTLTDPNRGFQARIDSQTDVLQVFLKYL